LGEIGCKRVGLRLGQRYRKKDRRIGSGETLP
jgi:hypothetical protein